MTMKKIILFLLFGAFALAGYSQIVPSTPVYGSLSVYKKLWVGDTIFASKAEIDTISGNSVDFNKVIGSFVTVDTSLLIRLMPEYPSDTFLVMRNDSIGIHIGIDSAALAGTADTAFLAGVADTAFLAGTADTAFLAGVADTAFLAGTADTAFVSGVSDTAFLAGVADTAFVSGVADTSFTSGVSDSVNTNVSFTINGVLIQGIADTVLISAADTLLGTVAYSVIPIEAAVPTDLDTITHAVTPGTVIELWGTDGNVTINDGMNINLAGGISFTFGAGDVMKLRFIFGEYYEISRSDN